MAAGAVWDDGNAPDAGAEEGEDSLVEQVVRVGGED